MLLTGLSFSQFVNAQSGDGSWPTQCSECLVESSVRYQRGLDLISLDIDFLEVRSNQNKMNFTANGNSLKLIITLAYDTVKDLGFMSGTNSDSSAYFSGGFTISNTLESDSFIDDYGGIDTLNYFKMQKDGQWSYSITSEGKEHVRVVTWKQGQLEGPYMHLINNIIDSKGEYHENKRVGEWIGQVDDGLIEYSCHDLNGFESYAKAFSKESQKLVRESFSSHALIKNSRGILFDSSSTLVKTYYTSGQVQSKRFVITVNDSNSRLISFEYWNNNGQKVVDVHWEAGAYLVKRWYDNGQIKSIERIKYFYQTVEFDSLAGEQIGEPQYWDEKGKVIKK